MPEKSELEAVDSVSSSESDEREDCLEKCLRCILVRREELWELLLFAIVLIITEVRNELSGSSHPLIAAHNGD